MSADNAPDDTLPEARGDNSLRNFFGGLLIVAIVIIALMVVIEQTAG